MFLPARSATATSRFSVSLCLAGILAFFAAAPLNEPAVPTVSQRATDAPDTSQQLRPDTVNLGPEEQAAIRAILELRRRQGGLLDGTGLGQADSASGDAAARSQQEDAEFAQVLQQVVATRHEDKGLSPSQEVLSPRDPSQAGPEPSQPGAPNADAALIDTLRLAARQLDAHAADLEGENRFRDADRLRALSNRLRREARRWVGPGTMYGRALGQATEDASDLGSGRQ